jgi:hypothetical protein
MEDKIMVSLANKATRFRTVVLASDGAYVPTECTNVAQNDSTYAGYVERIRSFRERIWQADGAIPQNGQDPHMDHFASFDEVGCHAILMNGADELVGCARYLMWDLRSGNFRLEQLALFPFLTRMASEQRALFVSAIQYFLDDSLARSPVSYRRLMESGGWAVDRREENRYAAPLLVAIGFALGLSNLCLVGLSAATVRHRSNSILKRLGMFELRYRSQALPTFFDPYHGCDMEILGSCRSPSQLIGPTVADYTGNFADIEVLTRQSAEMNQRRQTSRESTMFA